MIEPTSEIGKRAATTAAKLRAALVDLSDRDPAERREELARTVDRAAQAIPPQDRAVFLRTLAVMFPTGEAEAAPAAAPAKADDGAAAALRAELANPTALVKRLVEASGKLSAEERHKLGAMLSGAGLVEQKPASSGGGALSEAQEKELRTKLTLGATVTIDPARVADLAVMLSEFASVLDQVVWGTWRRVNAQSRHKRAQPLQATLGRFVSGDGASTRPGVAAEVDGLRRLVGALIAAISRSGRQYAQRHLMKFGVAAIEQAAGSGSVMSSADVKRWRKYVELMQGVDEGSIEAEIVQAIAEDAESLIETLTRAPGTSRG